MFLGQFLMIMMKPAINLRNWFGKNHKKMWNSVEMVKNILKVFKIEQKLLKYKKLAKNWQVTKNFM